MKVKQVIIIMTIFILSLSVYFIHHNQQYVDDYLYMWQKIEKYYPFYDYDSDFQSSKMKEIKDRYFKEVKFKVFDDVSFYDLINNVFQELNYTGHLSILDKNDCQMYQDIDIEIPKDVFQISFKPCLDSRVPTVKMSNDHISHDQMIRTETYLYNRVLRIFLPQMKYEYLNELKSIMGTIDNYDYLIIDLLYNGGGSDYLWLEGIIPYLTDQPIVIEKKLLIRNSTIDFYKRNDYSFIKEYPINELNSQFSLIEFKDQLEPVSSHSFKGKVYVMSYENNYSSAINFLEAVKQNKLGIIIGEKAYGDFGVNTPALFSLPNSHFVIRFALETSLNEDGLSMEKYGFTPDILSTFHFGTVFEEIQKDLKP